MRAIFVPQDPKTLLLKVNIPTKFLIPCTFCDELVVKGDEMPILLAVGFKILLNKTRRVLFCNG